MIRAFIAAELGDGLRRQIARTQQDLKERLSRAATGTARIAWVRPASMHLTLKFLGDIDEQRIGPLQDMIAATIRGHHAITIPLARLGAFPRQQEPRALWIGPPEPWESHDDAGRLAGLVRAIEDGCEGLGIPREHRPFAPHLTLARIKSGERHVGRALTDIGALDRPLASESIVVESLTLMKSQLNSAGAVHTRLWEVRLGVFS